MLADGSADFAVMTTIADDLVGETCTWDESSDDYGTCVVNDAAKPLRLYDGRPTVVSQDVLLYTFDIQ